VNAIGVEREWLGKQVKGLPAFRSDHPRAQTARFHQLHPGPVDG
jgi:hypothetical protein